MNGMINYKMAIGVSIVGFGYMGKFHYNKIKEYGEDIQVVSIYDIDELVLEDAKYNGLEIASSLDSIANDERISLVVIATPNDLHYEQAKYLLHAGKNVLCEKPAVLYIDELKELIRISQDKEKVFTVHQNRRWDKDFSVVRKVVDSKMIGDVVTIWSETFGQRGVCFGWRADPKHGGGMLYDWGIHLIDQILTLFSEEKVISVYGQLRSILTPAVDDYFEIELKFENDITAHITMGTFSLIDKPRWFVISDKGTLRIDDFSGTSGDIAKIKDNVRSFARVRENNTFGPSRTLAHLEWQNFETVNLPNPDNQPMEFYRNLIASIRGDESLAVNHAEIIRDMEIIEKVIESSKKKQVLEVSI